MKKAFHFPLTEKDSLIQDVFGRGRHLWRNPPMDFIARDDSKISAEGFATAVAGILVTIHDTIETSYENGSNTSLIQIGTAISALNSLGIDIHCDAENARYYFNSKKSWNPEDFQNFVLNLYKDLYGIDVLAMEISVMLLLQRVMKSLHDSTHFQYRKKTLHLSHGIDLRGQHWNWQNGTDSFSFVKRGVVLPTVGRYSCSVNASCHMMNKVVKRWNQSYFTSSSSPGA